MSRKITFSLIQKYGKEYLLTGIFGAIPSPIGSAIRNLIYPTIFKKIGKSVTIQPDVQFIGIDTIEIGDRVRVYRGSYISNKGSQIRLKDGVSLDHGVQIRAYDDERGGIEIGEETYIGPYVCIAGPGSIKIGRDCMIASNSSLYANNHNFSDPNTPFRFQGLTCKGIEIEDDCWIGTGVRVLDGVRIGKGSVIGAGAVVTRNIPPYSIAMGVPARVTGKRGQSKVERLQAASHS